MVIAKHLRPIFLGFQVSGRGWIPDSLADMENLIFSGKTQQFDLLIV